MLLPPPSTGPGPRMGTDPVLEHEQWCQFRGHFGADFPGISGKPCNNKNCSFFRENSRENAAVSCARSARFFLRYDHSKHAFSMHFDNKSSIECSPSCPTIMCSCPQILVYLYRYMYTPHREPNTCTRKTRQTATPDFQDIWPRPPCPMLTVQMHCWHPACSDPRRHGGDPRRWRGGNPRRQ